jgi:hypothetical protein
MTYMFILYLYSIIVLGTFFYKLGQTLHRLPSGKNYTPLYHGTEVVTRSLPLQESLVLLRNLGLQAREMHYAAVIFRIQQIRSLGWLDWFIWSRYTKGFRYWWTQNKFPWRPLNDSNGRYEALNNYLWQQKKLMGEVVPCQLSRCVGQSIPCRKHGDIR